jgi:hypothetical protein
MLASIDKKISELSEETTIKVTMEFVVNDSLVSKKVTWENLKKNVLDSVSGVHPFFYM